MSEGHFASFIEAVDLTQGLHGRGVPNNQALMLKEFVRDWITGDWNVVVNVVREFRRLESGESMMMTEQLRTCRLQERDFPCLFFGGVVTVVKPTAVVVVQRMPSDFDAAELAGFEGILTVSKRVLDFALFDSSLLDEAFTLLIEEVLVVFFVHLHESSSPRLPL